MMAEISHSAVNDPHLTLTIPRSLCKDYLGIVALDILHDAKGYGYLAGHKLSQLTDLLAESFIINNEDICDIREIRDYTFKQVLDYFLELWADNLSALGLSSRPRKNTKIETLRSTIKLPLRSVAGRVDEDTFIHLGKNKLGIEAQNYQDQREKLTNQHVELLSFISPRGIRQPSDYFHQASGIVDIIRRRTCGDAMIVLDMKSSAGLIRTITDPLGYITGLPTYSDPGYNMPGMSAIRQFADVTFVDDPQTNAYTGPKEFRFCVRLETPVFDTPLMFLTGRYFYGIEMDGLDRNNVMIEIIDEPFKNSLPRSTMMAEQLNNYLNPVSKEFNITARNTFSILQHIVWRFYDHIYEPIPYLELIQTQYSALHSGEALNVAALQRSNKLVDWCQEENQIFRSSYILATLKNTHLFGIQRDNLFPIEMITTTLPQLMYEYLTGDPKISQLAFCYHQLNLINQYIKITDQTELYELLENQWLPKRRGKLVSQITNQVTHWRKMQAEKMDERGTFIKNYLQQLLDYSSRRLSEIVDIDEYDRDDDSIDQLLNGMPIFKPKSTLQKTLLDHMYFYYPEIYHKSAHLERGGLLMAILLDTILWKKPLYKSPVDLQAPLTGMLHPWSSEYRLDQNKRETLRYVLGKFCGDFGQIMWSMCYNHIFASEDNNASAMALMLHRLPHSAVQRTGNGERWGNIHGLGDGSCVDITLGKN